MVSASSRLENFDRWGIKKMYQSMLKYDSENTTAKAPFTEGTQKCIENFQNTDKSKRCMDIIKKPKLDDI
jgi:hypothetical protein